MLLMIDNYDSFTYNLVQYFQMLNQEMEVIRNDEIDVVGVEKLSPSAICISPGPCTPNEAGISVELIKAYSGKLPILGVCLGMQSIGAAFGAEIIKAQKVMHGKTSQIAHEGAQLFKGIKSPFKAIRYHSLAIKKNTMPDCLKITARSEDDEIMGVEHVEHPTMGIQFHPESILTPAGKRMLGNFLELTK